jgi:hypothetical protein
MKTAFTLLALLLTTTPGLAQRNPDVSVCKQAAFAALKPLPELEYNCPQGLTDWDETILNSPGRKAAIKILEQELATFTDANWWRTDVADLDACTIHGSAGELTAEEQEKLKVGDFWYRLFGDHQYRLLLIADPCYQTGYGGSNAFLLYHKQGKVFISQVLNGYYSRIDNSLGMDSAKLNGQTVIEISTANNMPPETTNYYFAIDPKNNRAIPRKIFKVGGRLTNNISSAILFREHAPDDTPAPVVIRRNHLARTFSVYVDDYRGKIDDGGRKLRRVIYRWNGRYYYPAN